MKNGFTLIELLAVIVILAIILVIAVPRIMQTVENTRINTHMSNEKLIAKSAELYISKNIDKLPTNIGDTTEVLLGDLITDGYIKEIKNPFKTSEICNGYTLVTKISNDEYDYSPYIGCSNFKTDGYLERTGLVLHLASDEIFGIQNNEKVGKWFDLSGNNNHAIQNAVNNQPTYKINILKGNPAVSFVSNFMRVGEIDSTLKPIYAYVVSQRLVASGDNWQRVVASWDGVAADDYILNSWHIMSTLGTNGIPVVYNPAIKKAENSASSYSLKNFYIGCNATSGGMYFYGDIFEIIIYNRVLSVAERDYINAYLTEKWL